MSYMTCTIILCSTGYSSVLEDERQGELATSTARVMSSGGKARWLFASDAT